MGGVRVASCKTAQSSARRPRSGTHLGTSAQTARSTKQKSLNADIVRDAHQLLAFARALEMPPEALLPSTRLTARHRGARKAPARRNRGQWRDKLG
jgi:hypothetical protein